MKIEHWADRSRHPDRMYDWDNLLGVCGGEYRAAGRLIEHCDTSKRSESIAVHPGGSSPPRPEDYFHFVRQPPPGYTGARLRGIWVVPAPGLPSPEAQRAQGDIDTLNLNADHLVDNRWRAIEQVQTKLRARADSDSSVAEALRQALRTASEPGRTGLPPMAPLIARYVEDKLRQRGLSPAPTRRV